MMVRDAIWKFPISWAIQNALFYLLFHFLDYIESEKLFLFRTVGEYVLRNLAGNKIRVEGIYHDKRCVQGKTEQDPISSIALFCHWCYIMKKKEWRVIMTQCANGTIHTGNAIVGAHLKWGNSETDWNEGCDCWAPKAKVLLIQTYCKVYR